MRQGTVAAAQKPSPDQRRENFQALYGADGIDPPLLLCFSEHR